jgi:hypothetical protein
MAARYIRRMAGVRVLQVVALGLLISAGVWLLGGLSGQDPLPALRGPVGYSAHPLGQPDVARYTALIEDGGATSLRTDVSWASVQPTRARFNWSGPDEIVSQAASHHLTVLLIVDSTPAWASGAATSGSDWFWLPPHRPADYAAFAAAVAARYGPAARSGGNIRSCRCTRQPASSCGTRRTSAVSGATRLPARCCTRRWSKPPTPASSGWTRR